MSSVTDTVRMSHTQDPHTSKEAAEKVARSTNRKLEYGAILAALETAPMTPAEVHAAYVAARKDLAWLPDADLYELRRRMSELERTHYRIEPIQVGTKVDGSPQYATRQGQRVMRLVTS